MGGERRGASAWRASTRAICSRRATIPDFARSARRAPSSRRPSYRRVNLRTERSDVSGNTPEPPKPPDLRRSLARCFVGFVGFAQVPVSLARRIVASRLQSESVVGEEAATRSRGARAAPEGDKAMRTHGYTYQATLAASERINWRVEDLIGGDKRLDFSKPFMPESLARVEPLTFLSPREQLALNQIRGHGYLYTFGLVEEFILPFVLDHARPQLHGDAYAVRALPGVRRRGGQAHPPLPPLPRGVRDAASARRARVIGPPEAVAKAVLAHHPLAVALAILHIEWMTQRHWIEGVQDNQAPRPAVQEPAQAPLDGGGAARQARHADGRGAEPHARTRRTIDARRRGIPRDRRHARRRARPAGGIRPRQPGAARPDGRSAPAERETFVAVQHAGAALDLPRLRDDAPELRSARWASSRPAAADRVAKVAEALC